MSSWTVLPAPVPASLDAPDAWALHGAAAVHERDQRTTWQHTDRMYSASFLQGELAAQTYVRSQVLVAVPAGTVAPTAADVVGCAKVALPLVDNTHLADIEVYVDPDRRRDGVGSALIGAIERIAEEHGRTSILGFSEHVGEPPAGSPGVLEPPTGAGRISADHPGARFAQRHGYALEQAERYSMLQLPMADADLDRLQDGAAERAGADYRVHTWRDEVPDAWAAQVAVLKSRMSTDAPSADLDITESAWDADRIRTWVSEIATRGHGFMLSVAEHVPTATLAAFTMLSYPVAAPEVTYQNDTLVLREHRGHRLGMLVKTANLRALRTARPDARRVHTWNAQENAFMLDINVALGFSLAGIVGIWQKRLG